MAVNHCKARFRFRPVFSQLRGWPVVFDYQRFLTMQRAMKAVCSLRVLLKRKPRKDDSRKSGKVTSLAEAPLRTWNEMRTELYHLVESGQREKSERLLEELRRQYDVPSADISWKETWGLEKDQLILRTHAKRDIAVAIKNVESTGRKLGEKEKHQLETIASHWCYWSPTAEDHKNDSWMRYLRFSYPSLKGLQPVLDSLIWADEMARYPIGHTPLPPWLFLLATSSKFYVYNFQNDSMVEAGDTLTEVLDGMRHEGWDNETIWREVVSPTVNDTDYDPVDYFPVYLGVMHTAPEHRLEHKLQEFVSPGKGRPGECLESRTNSCTL